MAQDSIVHLSDTTFAGGIAKGMTLVDFYADWCGPCRMMAPILEQLSTELQGKVTIAKIDIETSQQVTSKFGVTSIPTLILFKNGQEVDRLVGVRDGSYLKKMIEKSS